MSLDEDVHIRYNSLICLLTNKKKKKKLQFFLLFFNNSETRKLWAIIETNVCLFC